MKLLSMFSCICIFFSSMRIVLLHLTCNLNVYMVNCAGANVAIKKTFNMANIVFKFLQAHSQYFYVCKVYAPLLPFTPYYHIFLVYLTEVS